MALLLLVTSINASAKSNERCLIWAVLYTLLPKHFGSLHFPLWGGWDWVFQAVFSGCCGRLDLAGWWRGCLLFVFLPTCFLQKYLECLSTLDRIRLECSEKHKCSDNIEMRFLHCLWLLRRELWVSLGCPWAHWSQKPGKWKPSFA